MELNLRSISKDLNKAYLKEKVSRQAIDRFKESLGLLFDRINENESEEHLKNILSDFLKDTWYKDLFEINTKNRSDLVIHTGKSTKESVGVILEVKKPSNKTEMMTVDRPNTKALQELVLYYLRERLDHGNIDIRYLIISNIYEWFVIDEIWFEKNIFRSVKLKKAYENWTTSGKDTKFFYESIAKPFLAEVNEPMPVVYFDIRDYHENLKNPKREDDVRLISLYKILSPQHLLKLSFSNDSNYLDKRFYTELLHIIGLEEKKEGNVNLIKRKQIANNATFIENTILKIEDKESLQGVSNIANFGDSRDERLFNISLELCITWINRILFIKLLEGQLIRYHKGDQNYLFLNSKKVFDFDELSSLFFQVLAENTNSRRANLKEKYSKVPYLNSSLFERIDLERQVVNISDLDNKLELPLYSNTVLKDSRGKRRTGSLPSLQYLLEFLDAYDFTSEGGEEIQEENKNLISASVLGLIFEKINGYKDGSYFTPGFITMYMCKETIRRAVVQKFNDTYGWDCTSIHSLYNKIEDKEGANSIINSLRICDPAVGSGHFLVSALNEIISIKSELKILLDASGKSLRDYHIEVVNDELTITDDDGRLFEYNPHSVESQRVQETLFHEKEIIIENCLFGVDINSNSVKICRLRLWIELLKNSYYTASTKFTELETLPNIDINIKCGNSLINRFGLNENIKSALKSKKWTIASYKQAVQTYRASESKDQKREMEIIIDGIKNDFRTEISRESKAYNDLSKLEIKYFELYKGQLFDQKPSKQEIKKREEMAESIQAKKIALEDLKNNKIYSNAFEWRFEFPEVLNDAGEFIGFDVVIGNPPYIRQEAIKDQKPFLQNNYVTYTGTADLYVFFVERGMNILKENGKFCYILPNKWMRAGYGRRLREFSIKRETVFMTDFGDLPVFEEATTYPSIWLMNNRSVQDSGFKAALIKTLTFPNGLEDYIYDKWISVSPKSLQIDGWNLIDDKSQVIMNKLKAKGVPLKEYVNGKIFYGIKTGFNDAFVINEETKAKLILEDSKSAQIIRPFLGGRDIKRYETPSKMNYLLFIPWHFPLHNDNTIVGASAKAEELFKSSFPAVYNHVLKYKTELENRNKAETGIRYEWYALQRCAASYFEEFDAPKILIPAIVKGASYTFDESKFYGNDKTSIIPLDDKYLLGLLNSKAIDYYLKQIASTKQNGYFEYKPVYISQLPIAVPCNPMKVKIETLVMDILNKKKEHPNTDTKNLEFEIDSLVNELYDLDESDVKIIESTS
jgi:hypothetical protein